MGVVRPYFASGSASMTPKRRPPGSAQAANQPIPGMGIFGSMCRRGCRSSDRPPTACGVLTDGSSEHGVSVGVETRLEAFG